MWINIKNTTHFSFLQSFSKPEILAKKAKENGISSFGICELNNLTSYVRVNNEFKNNDIKPIFGSSFRVKSEDSSGYITIIAKNKKGLKNMIKLSSLSSVNSDEYGPLLELNDLLNGINSDNIVLLGGNDSFFEKEVIIEGNLTNDSEKRILFITDKFLKISCEVFYCIDKVEEKILPNKEKINNLLRKISKINSIKCVATAESFYHEKENSEELKILICSLLKTTLPKIEKKLKNNEDFSYKHFFISDQFYTRVDVSDLGYTEEEIENTNVLNDMCENFDVFHPPKLPNFEWTDGMSEIEYVRHLCKEGWRKKYNYQWNKEIYGNRVKEELAIIEEANLSGYFLIVQDYVKYAKNQNWLVGSGRGSCSGSLVAFLLDITEIDPIKHNLIFSRFFNKGRALKGEYPDIDIDFPVKKREGVIQYIKKRYGEHRVSQMITIGRLQGSSALKEVLKVHEACDFSTSNDMTKALPKEHEIDEFLKDMNVRSILLWTLENEPKKIENYCRLNKEGKLEGDYAMFFEQAIKLEGTYKSSGKHAAGIVISRDTLSEECPMAVDKSDSNKKLAGLEMSDLEKTGNLKFDILGLLTLDRLMATQDLLQYGKIVR